MYQNLSSISKELVELVHVYVSILFLVKRANWLPLGIGVSKLIIIPGRVRYFFALVIAHHFEIELGSGCDSRHHWNVFLLD